jgi:hypothetical protein
LFRQSPACAKMIWAATGWCGDGDAAVGDAATASSKIQSVVSIVSTSGEK